MKWPLVWRSTMNEVCALAEARANRALLAEQHYAAQIAKNWELQDTIDKQAELLSGAARANAEAYERITELNLEVSRLTPKMDAVRERSRLTTAIRDQARQPDGTIDRRLVSHFRGQANALRREGKSVDEIIDSIGEWQTTEDRDKPTVDAIVKSFTDASL